MPGGESGVEPPRVVDPEVGEPRPDARLVDDPVAEVTGRKQDVRLQRLLDDRGIGAAPTATPVSTPTWPRSTSPKRPARPAICASSHGSRSRRDSPSNFVVSAKSSVSQGRLTPWPSTSVATVTSEAPLEEAVDLLAPRAERHRAVEHGDAARVEPVDLAREREHRLAAEGDDDGARA